MADFASAKDDTVFNFRTDLRGNRRGRREDTGVEGVSYISLLHLNFAAISRPYALALAGGRVNAEYHLHLHHHHPSLLRTYILENAKDCDTNSLNLTAASWPLRLKH